MLELFSFSLLLFVLGEIISSEKNVYVFQLKPDFLLLQTYTILDTYSRIGLLDMSL